MDRVLSTYRWVGQPLTLALIADIAGGGNRSIEVFCAHGHFNYVSQQSVRELSEWLRDHAVTIHSLHSPTERESVSGRGSGTPISISDTERVRRLDAVDEVKRAIDVAERIPFSYLVQHLANGRQSADPRRRDAAFNSLEHLAIFAKQRGVTIALENTPGELTSPESLHSLILETHLNDLRFCIDVGHAHMEDGVASAVEVMRDRIVTTHLHDNHGDSDEHLLPFEGTIDWPETVKLLGSTPNSIPLVLELKEQASGAPSMSQVRAAFDRLEQEIEDERARSSES
jgi:sugar phosphate isomerase/epimerase